MRLDDILSLDTITCACARYGMAPTDHDLWRRVHEAMSGVEQDLGLTLFPWQHAYIVGHATSSDVIVFHGAAAGKSTALRALADVMGRLGL